MRVIVALFLAVVGTVVLSGRQRSRPAERPTHLAETVGIGALAQLSAVMAGIGGPAVTVPALTAQGQEQVMAIGTGLLHGIIASAIGMAVLIAATGTIEPTADLFAFPAIVVAFACLANLLRARFTSHELIRRVVGVASIVGALTTLLVR
jgi:uncharacterized membrane protein YfcA